MIRTGLASVLLAMVVGACAHHEQRSEPAMTPAAARTNDNERSIFAITDQRCQREVRCDNVGADKSYTSVDECRKQLNQAGYDSLSTDNCPTGIDPDALATCLHSIQSEECGKPLDSLERMVDCRKGKLCAAAAD